MYFWIRIIKLRQTLKSKQINKFSTLFQLLISRHRRLYPLQNVDNFLGLNYGVYDHYPSDSVMMGKKLYHDFSKTSLQISDGSRLGMKKCEKYKLLYIILYNSSVIRHNIVGTQTQTGGSFW